MLSLLAMSVLGAPLDFQPPREFRAAWVATVDNIDWPSKPGLSEDTQRSEMIKILDTLEDLNMNAVIFQIRPSADSFYRSKIEPWSYYLSGTSGKGPSYDPLQFVVKEAHARGIEVHVWFNPYRAKHPVQKADMAANHISKTHPEAVYSYGGYLWMDPGSRTIQNRSYDVFMDVLSRYDIDGMHIDDYFYPYPVRESGKVVPFPDDATYQAYQKRGGTLGKSDWRRKNVDDFIERVYKGIKAKKPWVKFGISPFGIARPGIPKGITAGVDQYEDLSADALKWWQNGWCDYYAPQLYWPIEQTAQSFPVLLKFWEDNNKQQCHLWPGLYTGRVGEAWEVDQVVRQLGLISKSTATGAIHFSMKSFTNNYKNINAALKSGAYKEHALVPASPWNDQMRPSAPSFTIKQTGILFGEHATDDRYYGIAVRTGGTWKVADVFAAEKAVRAIPTGVKSSDIAVFAVDRSGNCSSLKPIAP